MKKERVASGRSPWRADLAVEAASVRAARHMARDFARDQHLDGSTQDFVLITSELVSNAVQHAHAGVHVSMRRDGHLLRVEVSDDDQDAPRRFVPDQWSESGRGLMIVDTIARSWGVDRHDRGKTVWAELECD